MEEQTINLEQLSHKDEFHLLRVPKGFDINQLNGVTYSPDETVEIETNKDQNGLITVYELGTHSIQSMDLNVLVKSDGKIKAGPALFKNLSITKTVRLDSTETHVSIPGLQNAPSGNVSLPMGLKERFTPFGSSSPTHEKKKSKKEKKRKRQSDSSPPPSEKRQRLLGDDDIKKEVSTDQDYSVGAFGDAGNVMDTPTADRGKKHKKKRKSKKSEFQMNGDSGPEVNNSYESTNKLNLSVFEDRSLSEFEKLHKTKRKDSSHNETMQISRDNSFNLTFDQPVVKKHKKKKIKDEK